MFQHDMASLLAFLRRPGAPKLTTLRLTFGRGVWTFGPPQGLLDALIAGESHSAADIGDALRGQGYGAGFWGAGFE